MLSVRSPSASAPTIDWSNAYSTANLPKSGAEELARREAAGEVVGRSRMLMTKADQAIAEKVRHERAEQRVEKGCSKEVFNDLVGMAKNPLHFIQLCAEEADKRAGHTNLRKSFRDAKASDMNTRGPFRQVETAAWRNRPIGCDSLKEALVVYTTDLEKRIAAEKNPTGKHLIEAELDQAHEAKANLEHAAEKSQTRYQFPDSGGFIKIQKATAAFRADEDRLVARGRKRKTMKEKFERWPCLTPGWPDEMAGRLTLEEIELRRLESGNGNRGLQQPDAPITVKKSKQTEAPGSSSLAPRALSPSLLPVAVKPLLVEVPGGAVEEAPAPPVDRRFGAEPARAAVVTQIAPNVVQAFANGLERAPHDLSDFDPVEVAAYRKTVLLFDPKTRRPRTPTRNDLLKKGLRPVPSGAISPAVLEPTTAPSAKALGKRPMK